MSVFSLRLLTCAKGAQGQGVKYHLDALIEDLLPSGIGCVAWSVKWLQVENVVPHGE